MIGLEGHMTNTITNYEQTKIAMSHVFLQYDQEVMIHKFSLEHTPDWIYLIFINRNYRINRKTGMSSAQMMSSRPSVQPDSMKQ